MTNKEILRLAIPNIISNVSVPLLSTVDTALMGHLSIAHLGAVGLGSMIFNFVYWNFGFLRMGTTGITAQGHGANDPKSIGQALGHASAVAIGLAILLLVFQHPIEYLSLRLLHVDIDQVSLVSTYFGIRIWAAPAALMSYVVLGWLFGMQNALYPLFLTITVNAINIVLSFIFIYHFQMGIEGVAWGTVIAQHVGLVIGLFMLWHKYRSYLHEISLGIFKEMNALKRFFSLNVDLFIRTLCLTFVFAFFYSQSSTEGTLILAVNVVLLQLVNWMSYGVDGFAFAAESLVGKYKGRRDEYNVNKTINYSMKWGIVMALMFSTIYALLGDEIVGIFTNEAQIIEASSPYMIYMVLFPIVGFMSYIWDGIYIGLTASRTMRNAMIVSLMAFLAIHYSLRGALANHGLWISLLLFLMIRGLSQSLLYYKYGWNLK